MKLTGFVIALCLLGFVSSILKENWIGAFWAFNAAICAALAGINQVNVGLLEELAELRAQRIATLKDTIQSLEQINNSYHRRVSR